MTAPRAILTPEEAHALASTGDLVLVDVRQPAEWAQTGVPESAEPVTMHEPGFLDRLAAVGGTKDAAIGVICAAGGRSAAVQAELARLGFTNVSDVAEGVQGGQNGPGWIRRGLPMKRV